MKKTMMVVGVMMGMAGAMYYYFKKNPEKLEDLKYKMLTTACEMEDDMMM